MSNLENRKAVDKAILECKKTLFECAIRREQIEMSRDLAKIYMEDTILSDSVDMRTAIRMQETLEDRYYMEEGGILSSVGNAIMSVFTAIKEWLFGSNAPSNNPSDYAVKEVEPSKPVDINSLEEAAKRIGEVSTDLENNIKNAEDIEKNKGAIKEIKDTVASALKPSATKVSATIAIAGLITVNAAIIKSFQRVRKTHQTIAAHLDRADTEEDKKKAQEAMGIVADLATELANAEKRVAELLAEAEGENNNNNNDNNGEPKDGTTFDSSMSDAQKDRIRKNYFENKFKYTCMEKDVEKFSKGIPERMFPERLRLSMKDEETLNVTQIKEIANALKATIAFLPEGYKGTVNTALEKVRLAKKDPNDPNYEVYRAIPEAFWEVDNGPSRNPYRLPFSYKIKYMEDWAKNSGGNAFAQKVLRAYCDTLGLNPGDPDPFAPPTPAELDDLKKKRAGKKGKKKRGGTP